MPPRSRVGPRPGGRTVPGVPIARGSVAEALRLSAANHWGFSRAEVERIRAQFRREGRDPTEVELAGLAQSWSEHCSYKSSRIFLRRGFGRFAKARRVLGTGDAGVVRFDDRFAYALRIESHNHPSAVEPYGGAATGIGGILRDVLAVGAKPIALADPLFFGPLDLPDAELPKGIRHPRYLYDGVIAGIRDYGNRVGVPTVTGGIYFDPAYTVNPLVNVACVGWLPTRRLRPNRAQRAGNALVLAGGLTGRDGLGGVAFASRELTERSEDESRGAVQLGNPIMKEPLIHACLEAFDAGLVESLKDLGGGGLATASGELVHAGGFGSELHLDRVPLRQQSMPAWEIWISESQERMILEVRPSHLDRVLGIFRKHDVPATHLGDVVPGHRERLWFHGELVADLALAFRVDPPLLRRRTRPPRAARGRRARVPDQGVVDEVAALLLTPENRSRESVLRLYDHEVQGRTVVKPLHGRPDSPTHGDAAVIQPRPDSRRGLAMTVGAHPWAGGLDPRRGAMLAVEEVARNLYAVGARPDAMTDCLNFGSPEDPRVLGAFDASVRGLADAAHALDMVVPSGNVSFYNEGLGRSVLPTPVLLGVGVVEDIGAVVTADLKAPGNRLYQVGRGGPGLGGSLYARRHRLAGLAVPAPSPGRLRTTGDALRSAMRSGLVRACHDVADGGLGVTLAEMAFGGGVGFSVDLAGTGFPGPGVAAVSEAGGRWVVEVAAADARAFERRMARHDAALLGEVTEHRGDFRWRERSIGQLDLPAAYDAWRAGPAPG